MTYACRACGAPLPVDGKGLATCEYCKMTTVVPRLDDERWVGLYSRANNYLRGGEFDRAQALYEQIISESPNDAEAFWSLALCQYGVEFVEDPASKRRTPTCNRTSYVSILSNAAYQSAVSLASPEVKTHYVAMANEIDRLQKNILSISRLEKPYDVFLCYKENDESGRRTPDSVLAQELYHKLAEAGYRVFFARITLEDKLGTEYEPYIFAALHSAQVMVVFGTRPEYFEAVWVKNEWSRYLALIETGEKKTLIPAYRDMSPQELPSEFSNLQAQDMEKLGFMQDLARGVCKLLGEAPRSNPQQTKSIDLRLILRRSEICIEDSNWEKADELLERVLNANPENARAYFYKIMVQHHAHDEYELLTLLKHPLKNNRDFQRALLYADEDYKAFLLPLAEKSMEQAKKATQDIQDSENDSDPKIEQQERILNKVFLGFIGLLVIMMLKAMFNP